MARSWMIGIGLIVALVFSQSLQASHDNAHLNDPVSDCRICLQAAGAGFAVPAAETGQALVPADYPHSMGDVLLSSTVGHYHTHPTRAPPLALI